MLIRDLISFLTNWVHLHLFLIWSRLNKFYLYLFIIYARGTIYYFSYQIRKAGELNQEERSRDAALDVKAMSIHALEKASYRDGARAQCELGLRYAFNTNPSKHRFRAESWLRMSAERGFVKAKYYLGVLHSSRRGMEQNFARAARWYRAAAEQGMSIAAFSLGVIYSVGLGVPQSHRESFKWFRSAAENGLADAQSHLGLMYLEGNGVQQDDAEAARWFRKAACGDFPERQSDAGEDDLLALVHFRRAYGRGKGVPEAAWERLEWYCDIAERNVGLAQVLLAGMYILGRGVPRDYSAAYMWLKLAQDRGCDEAAKLLSAATGVMSAEQVAKGRLLVKECAQTCAEGGQAMG